MNQVLPDIPYPLPDTEDIFATLGSGTVFSNIDLSNAYQQMELSTNSQPYLTVNTHKGLYAYQRLTYDRWMLSFSSILNEIVKDSIEALHYCEIDVKIVKNVSKCNF